jgi:hypothetical protein
MRFCGGHLVLTKPSRERAGLSHFFPLLSSTTRDVAVCIAASLVTEDQGCDSCILAFGLLDLWQCQHPRPF